MRLNRNKNRNINRGSELDRVRMSIEAHQKITIISSAISRFKHPIQKLQNILNQACYLRIWKSRQVHTRV
uniref:Uncharacterized protein n=1 Tax=Solanum tuberosum TaxID=4113 RepID=M0ZQ09_SOLTU